MPGINGAVYADILFDRFDLIKAEAVSEGASEWTPLLNDKMKHQRAMERVLLLMLCIRSQFIGSSAATASSSAAAPGCREAAAAWQL